MSETSDDVRKALAAAPPEGQDPLEWYGETLKALEEVAALDPTRPPADLTPVSDLGLFWLWLNAHTPSMLLAAVMNEFDRRRVARGEPSQPYTYRPPEGPRSPPGSPPDASEALRAAQGATQPQNGLPEADTAAGKETPT